MPDGWVVKGMSEEPATGDRVTGGGGGAAKLELAPMT
jgi:hypothetical protein